MVESYRESTSCGSISLGLQLSPRGGHQRSPPRLNHMYLAEPHFYSSTAISTLTEGELTSLGMDYLSNKPNIHHSCAKLEGGVRVAYDDRLSAALCTLHCFFHPHGGGTTGRSRSLDGRSRSRSCMIALLFSPLWRGQTSGDQVRHIP